MVKVLAMTKTPTNSAIPAKARSIRVSPLVPSAISCACSSASWAPLVTVMPSAGSSARILLVSSWLSVPGAELTSSSSNWPGCRKSCCAALVSKSARLPPAVTRGSSVVTMPTSVLVRVGPCTAKRTESPMW